jgi:hypothetical protein
MKMPPLPLAVPGSILRQSAPAINLNCQPIQAMTGTQQALHILQTQRLTGDPDRDESEK